MSKKAEAVIIVKHYFKSKLVILINIVSLMVSWHFNESVLWGIFHYIFGLPYLIYSMLSDRFVDGAFIEIMQSYF